MMSDLEERERNAFYQDPTSKAKNEEENIARKLREEINRIRAMHGNKMNKMNEMNSTTTTEGETSRKKEKEVGEKSSVVDMDKEKMLKVSWEKGGLDYSAERLRGLFETFGEVKDVVIRSSKKKGSALVVMASKEAAISATGTVCGDLSNPLLVIPLQPAVSNVFPTAREPVKSNGQHVNEDLVGARYQAFEDSVLQKLQKAAERQK
ncbi:hypothetical protein L1887_35102 [Cichorium endivia]|nr:hypothetical protein L1887_35102 [Cichorium endivia]